MELFQPLWDAFASVFSAVFDFLGTVVSVVFFWLPDSPLSSIWPDVTAFVSANITAIKWLNWFVPVGPFSIVFSVVLSCFLLWIAYMCATHVLDWVKTIKQTINPGG